MPRFSLVFGALLAYVLLVIYVGTIADMCWTVVSSKRSVDSDKASDAATKETSSSTPVGAKSSDTGQTLVVTLIGALISALVVSRLAVTDPGHSPAEFAALRQDTGFWKNVSYALVYIYLLAWIGAGVAALACGVIMHPEANATLSDIGTTWLGTAVASAYAYFGLKEPAPRAFAAGGQADRR